MRSTYLKLSLKPYRSGQVQVCFKLQLKFNYLELDSEVGQLVQSEGRT